MDEKNPIRHGAVEGMVPPTVAGALGRAPVQWPKVIGILSIVLGSLGVLSNAWQVLSTIFAGAIMGLMSNFTSGTPAQGQFDATTQALRDVQVPMALGYGGSLVASVLLVVAGARSVQRRAETASLHAWYAWLRIASGIVVTIATVVMQQRMMAAMATTTPMPAGMGGFVEAMQYVGMAFGILWVAAYPIFVLVWFRRRAVRELMATWPR